MNKCPWIEDSNDALLIVAEKIRNSISKPDLSEEYKEKIRIGMFNEYEQGRTWTRYSCNREIKLKFRKLFCHLVQTM
jgi:tRNA-specific 2-thiouridylase